MGMRWCLREMDLHRINIDVRPINYVYRNIYMGFKICRVSENIFYFWFTRPIQLEVYIQDIKEKFQKKGEESDVPYSFSVGAIYNNTVGKENLDELIDRCSKMRLLDEKHAEAKFIEGKMKML